MASQSSFLRMESSKPSTTGGRYHLSCHRKPYFHCTGVSKVFLASWFSPRYLSAWGTYTVHTTHWNPLQCSCLENPMDRGALQAAVHGATKIGHNSALNHHHHDPLEQRITRKWSCQKTQVAVSLQTAMYVQTIALRLSMHSKIHPPLSLKTVSFETFFFHK